MRYPLSNGDYADATVSFDGRNGSVYTKSTTAVTGSFMAIQVVADAVFSTLTVANLTGDSIIGDTVPAGTILYGTISAYTLTSGKVIAYKA